MEERLTVGRRVVISRTEHDRNAEQLQAEAYQHLTGWWAKWPAQKIDLDLIVIARLMEESR